LHGLETKPKESPQRFPEAQASRILGGDSISASSLDHTVRSVIEKAGFGQNFIHTSGHGLGLEIHEAPSLNSKNLQALKPGMVLALEPGIYLPGEFGYRHENTIHNMIRDHV
jgi:Xaa-Pro aminopeptidase